LGAAGFLAAASAGVGRGDGNGALVSDGVEDGGDDDAAGRGAAGVVVACPGSGAMMLMGGVEAAVKSALVGLPSGIDGGRAATGAGAAAGMFHDGA
jgi:hypothetical protein